MVPIDEKIIHKINVGDKNAFSHLYESYYLYLNATAFYYVNDENVSAEIVNDVFVDIWNKRESLVYPVHSYLVRAVRNDCIDFLRTQRVQEQVLDKHREQQVSFHENYILSTPQPLQYVELLEVESEIRKAMEKLPEKCRIIFEKHFFAGQSTEEIAEDLNIQVGTVRVQLKNAIDRLKPLLGHLLSIFVI